MNRRASDFKLDWMAVLVAINAFLYTHILIQVAIMTGAI